FYPLLATCIFAEQPETACTVVIRRPRWAHRQDASAIRGSVDLVPKRSAEFAIYQTGGGQCQVTIRCTGVGAARLACSEAGATYFRCCEVFQQVEIKVAFKWHVEDFAGVLGLIDVTDFESKALRGRF